MGRPLKRVNTYAEIFESEKNYVSDLKLWGTTFRKRILTSDTISPQRKLVINRGIFANIDNVIELHTQILTDMAMMNEACRAAFVMNYCFENKLCFDDVWNSFTETFIDDKKEPTILDIDFESKFNKKTSTNAGRENPDSKNADDTCTNLHSKDERPKSVIGINNEDDHKQNIHDSKEDDLDKNYMKFKRARSLINFKIGSGKSENILKRFENEYKNGSKDNVKEEEEEKEGQSEIKNDFNNEEKNNEDTSSKHEMNEMKIQKNLKKTANENDIVDKNNELYDKNDDRITFTSGKSLLRPKNPKSQEKTDSEDDLKLPNINLNLKKDSKNLEKSHKNLKEKKSYKHIKFNFSRNDIYQSLIVNTDEDALVYSILCYEEIYDKYLKRFDMYNHYIHKMPRMQYLMEREIQINPRFNSFMNDFFSEHGIRLGYLNFIFRPTQKLTRYPLLLKNIKKYAFFDDDEIKLTYENEIKNQKENLNEDEDKSESEEKTEEVGNNKEKHSVSSLVKIYENKEDNHIEKKINSTPHPNFAKKENPKKIPKKEKFKKPKTSFESIKSRLEIQSKKTIQDVDNLILYFSQKSNEADTMLKDGNNQFEMYKLFLYTQYAEHIHPRIGLSLFLRERKKIFSMDNVLVRSQRHYEPKYFTVLVMDHMTLICDVVDQGFYKKYNVIDMPLASCKWKCEIYNYESDKKPNMYCENVNKSLNEVGDKIENEGERLRIENARMVSSNQRNIAKNDKSDKTSDRKDIKYFRNQYSIVVREIDGDNELYMYFNDEKMCHRLLASMKVAIELTEGRYDRRIRINEIGKISIQSNEEYYDTNEILNEKEEMNSYDKESVIENNNDHKNKFCDKNISKSQDKNVNNIQEDINQGNIEEDKSAEKRVELRNDATTGNSTDFKYKNITKEDLDLSLSLENHERLYSYLDRTNEIKKNLDQKKDCKINKIENKNKNISSEKLGLENNEKLFSYIDKMNKEKRNINGKYNEKTNEKVEFNINENMKLDETELIIEMVITDILYNGNNINQDDEERLGKYMDEIESLYKDETKVFTTFDESGSARSYDGNEQRMCGLMCGNMNTKKRYDLGSYDDNNTKPNSTLQDDDIHNLDGHSSSFNKEMDENSGRWSRRTSLLEKKDEYGELLRRKIESIKVDTNEKDNINESKSFIDESSQKNNTTSLNNSEKNEDMSKNSNINIVEKDKKTEEEEAREREIYDHEMKNRYDTLEKLNKNEKTQQELIMLKTCAEREKIIRGIIKSDRTQIETTKNKNNHKSEIEKDYDQYMTRTNMSQYKETIKNTEFTENLSLIIRESAKNPSEEIATRSSNKDDFNKITFGKKTHSNITNTVEKEVLNDSMTRELRKKKKLRETIYDNKYLVEEGECLDLVSVDEHVKKVDYRKENNKVVMREAMRFQMELFGLRESFNSNASNNLKQNRPRNDNLFLAFFTTSNGIYMKNGPKVTRIYKNYVTSLFYIRKRKILCFLEESSLKYSKVSFDTEQIYPLYITNRISKFFYGHSQGKELLIVSLESTVSSSFLHLYELITSENENDDTITFRLATMLYIGGEIHSLNFYGDKILTCCREIDIIDLKTLRVQSMLDSTDIALKMFGMDFIKTKCRGVFRIRPNVYLIVNDKVGFIVDEFGSIFDRTLYFVWYDTPTEFRVFDRYLVVINPKSCVVYDCETGWIVAYIKAKGLRFVNGCTYPWVHDGHRVYELTFPIGDD